MSSNKFLNIMHNYLNSIKTDKESGEIDHKSGRINMKNKDSYVYSDAHCFFSVVLKEEEPEPLPSSYYKDIDKAIRDVPGILGDLSGNEKLKEFSPNFEKLLKGFGFAEEDIPALLIKSNMNNFFETLLDKKKKRLANITPEKKAAIAAHNAEMKERHEKSTVLYTELDPNKRLNKYNETNGVKLYVYNDTDEES